MNTGFPKQSNQQQGTNHFMIEASRAFLGKSNLMLVFTNLIYEIFAPCKQEIKHIISKW